MNIILLITLIIIGYIIMKFVTRIIWNRHIVRKYHYTSINHEDWLWPIILIITIAIIVIENIKRLENKIDIY